MRKLDIKIVLNTNIVQDYGFNIPDFDNNSPMEIRGINDLTIIEDPEVLTSEATFTLPLSMFVVNKSGLFALDSEQVKRHIYSDTKIAIFATYEGLNPRMIFKGYLVSYDIQEENLLFNCEDQMRFLKLQPKLKKSFPSSITIGTIEDNLFLNERFTLRHLIYWMFRNDSTIRQQGTALSDEYIKNIQPFSHIYVIPDLKLDKLVMDNMVHPATILDKLNDSEAYYFRAFVRADNFQEIGVDGITYLIPEYNLYVGWKNWLGLDAIDVKQEILNKGKSQYVTIGKDTEHSNNLKFAYPRLAGTNPILSHTIKWNDTKKDKLVIKVITENANGEVAIYYYPTSSAESLKLQTLQKVDDTDLESTEVINKIKASGDKDYFSIVDSEENNITIKMPGLEQKDALELAKYRYDNYKDAGYRGTFTTFGEPYIRTGDIIELNLKIYPNQEVYDRFSYYVDKVERYLNDDGYTQTITIGNRYFTNEQLSLI